MAYADKFTKVSVVGEFDKAPVLYKGSKELDENGSPLLMDRYEAKAYLTEKYVGDYDPIEIEMSFFGKSHNGEPLRL